MVPWTRTSRLGEEKRKIEEEERRRRKKKKKEEEEELSFDSFRRSLKTHLFGN